MYENHDSTYSESIQRVAQPARSKDTLLEDALFLARQGMAVFPCAGKDPAIKGGQGCHDASTDPEQVRAMWQGRPYANIGLATGKKSGIWVLDIDGEEGEKALAELEAKNGKLPDTVVSLSGGGGRHLLFRYHGEPVKNRRSDIGTDLDSRGEGGYIIAPPSIHPDTQQPYQWEDGVLPDLDSIADAPAWLIKLVCGPNKKQRERQGAAPARQAAQTPLSSGGGYYEAALNGECSAVAKATSETGRNNQLNISAVKLGGYIAAGHLERSAVERALLAASVANGYVAEHSENAALATIASGLNFGIAQGPKSAPEPELKPPPVAVARAKAAPVNPPDGEWNQPFDIFGDCDLTGIPEMPRGSVPDVIEAFARDEGERLGVDPAMIASGCIVACAAVTSDEWKIQPKQHDTTWTESSRLWLGTIAPPSAKKTPALNAVINPLRQIDRTYAEEDEPKHEQYEVDTKIHQKRMDAFATAKAKGEDVPQPLPPVKPPYRRLVVNDVTVPKLSEILADNPNGVICVNDELASWFASLNNRDTGAKDRADWLSAYNGGPHVVDRIKRGTVRVPNWSVSLIGTIQPGKLREVTSGMGDDGLMQRFMLVYAHPAGRGADRAPDTECISRYHTLISTLKDLVPAHRERPFRLSETARAKREMMLDIIDLVMTLPNSPEPLRYHMGKWDGLFARLCLTFHMIEAASRDDYPMPEISGDTATRVLIFMRDLLLPNAMKFYREVFSESPTLELARWIAGYIVANGKEKVTQRDVYRSYSSNLRDKPHMIHDAMRLLDLAGWVDPVENRNGRDVTEWLVNAAVHTVFAQRAKEEKSRRENVKAAIAKAAKLGVKGIKSKAA